MNASELRIGNLLYSDNVVVTIDGRSIFDFWSYGKEYKPILLTEELLFRLGFEYERNTIGGFERWQTKTSKGRTIKILDKKFSWGYDQYSDYILYVHQLQNLYFALTGEELYLR